jgi:HAD superfamily hydrolase (TIGR01509 family)
VSEAADLRRAMTAELVGQVPAGTLPALDKLLADGWQLGLVSNTTAESPERFRESPLAARFAATAFSSELGTAKPEPAIHLAACAALAVDPAASAYVDDGADNELAATAALGMPAIRTTQHADNDPSWTGPPSVPSPTCPPRSGDPLSCGETGATRSAGHPDCAAIAMIMVNSGRSAVDRGEVPRVRAAGDQLGWRVGERHRLAVPARDHHDPLGGGEDLAGDVPRVGLDRGQRRVAHPRDQLGHGVGADLPHPDNHRDHIRSITATPR